jgi:hypothetical protein
VQCLFGKVEIAEKADQGGEHVTRFGAVDAVNGLPHLLGGRFSHPVVSLNRYLLLSDFQILIPGSEAFDLGGFSFSDPLFGAHGRSLEDVSS